MSQFVLVVAYPQLRRKMRSALAELAAIQEKSLAVAARRRVCRIYAGAVPSTMPMHVRHRCQPRAHIRQAGSSESHVASTHV